MGNMVLSSNRQTRNLSWGRGRGRGFHSGLHEFDVSTQTDYLWAGRDAAGDETGRKMNRFHRS